MGEETDVTQRLEQMHEDIETDDVGQQRYLMYRILDEALDEHHEDEITPEERVTRLRETDGYMYKLAQDFLTSSSTLEKKRKIKKIIDHIGS